MSNEEKRYSASYVTGIIALVFLVVGYQTALFIHRASVEKIVSNRDSPDTVYVQMNGSNDFTRQKPDKQESDSQVVAKKEAYHSPKAKAIAAKHRQVRSFKFDPNTATIDELQLLGFSAKQAQSIDNYRKKGGRFHRKSDFAKSYVVSEEIYKRLEPYIDIPLIDLNTADSAAFDALPGIGGYFASKMVAHRKALGGSYSFKEQLMDIYHFDQEKFNALEDLIVVSDAHITPYRLWTLPEDSLKLHPYIGRNAAHGITVFRQNNPPEKWTIKSLSDAGIIKADKAVLLSKCRIEAPL